MERLSNLRPGRILCRIRAADSTFVALGLVATHNASKVVEGLPIAGVMPTAMPSTTKTQVPN